jgi:hypothetical protein
MIVGTKICHPQICRIAKPRKWKWESSLVFCPCLKAELKATSLTISHSLGVFHVYVKYVSIDICLFFSCLSVFHNRGLFQLWTYGITPPSAMWFKWLKGKSQVTKVIGTMYRLVAEFVFWNYSMQWFYILLVPLRRHSDLCNFPASVFLSSPNKSHTTW